MSTRCVEPFLWRMLSFRTTSLRDKALPLRALWLAYLCIYLGPGTYGLAISYHFQ